MWGDVLAALLAALVAGAIGGSLFALGCEWWRRRTIRRLLTRAERKADA